MAPGPFEEGVGASTANPKGDRLETASGCGPHTALRIPHGTKGREKRTLKLRGPRAWQGTFHGGLVSGGHVNLVKTVLCLISTRILPEDPASPGSHWEKLGHLSPCSNAYDPCGVSEFPRYLSVTAWAV